MPRQYSTYKRNPCPTTRGPKKKIVPKIDRRKRKIESSSTSSSEEADKRAKNASSSSTESDSDSSGSTAHVPSDGNFADFEDNDDILGDRNSDSEGGPDGVRDEQHEELPDLDPPVIPDMPGWQNAISDGSSDEHAFPDLLDVDSDFNLPSPELEDNGDSDSSDNPAVGEEGHAGDNDDNAEEDLYTANDFKYEFMMQFLCSKSITKKTARTIWYMVKKLIAPLLRHAPSYISGLCSLGSFEAEVAEYNKGIPAITTDYIVLNKETLEEIPVLGKESFPIKLYPTHTHKLLVEKSYCKVQDAVQFMTQFHDDKRLNGRTIRLSWDHVQESKSTSHKLSVISLSLNDCRRRAVSIQTTKIFDDPQEKYTSFDILFEPIQAEIIAANHIVKAFVADKVVRNLTNIFRLYILCHKYLLITLQARDKMLNHKNHIAKYACDKCDIKATNLVVKEGYVNENGRRIRAKTFRFYPWTEGVNDHTDEIIRHLMSNPDLTEEERKGFKGRSIILDMPNFNLVKNIPLDYMHLMCLRCTKRMFGLTYKINHSSLPNKRSLVKPESIETYNDFIVHQRQPTEFPRRPRRMDFCNLKASEWRTVGLCNALHIIDNCHDPLLKLTWSMYFWIKRAYVCTTNEELQEIDVYMDMIEFIKNFKLCYEKTFSKYNCSYNIHCIEHLPKERLMSGSLVHNAAYIFEGLYGDMLAALCVGTRNTTRQAMMGSFFIYRGRRGKHLCQNAIQYQPAKPDTMHDDSLAYTKEGFWYIHKVNKTNKTCHCSRLNVLTATLPCKYAPRQELKLSLIGVYKFSSIDENITHSFHYSDFLGKFMRVQDYLVKIPKDILLECT